MIGDVDPDELGGVHLARLEVVLGPCICDTGLSGRCPLTGWQDLGPLPGSPDLRVFRQSTTLDWLTVDPHGSVVACSAFGDVVSA